MAPDQDPPDNGQLAVNCRVGPRRRGSSRIRPDVAAAPAAPPPAAPDRAASGTGVCTSVMAAASTHRYIVFVRGSGYPARHIPAHLDPLLHIGGTLNRLEGTRFLPAGQTPNAELGRGIGHLPSREWPKCARRSCAAVWRACREPRWKPPGRTTFQDFGLTRTAGRDASEAADCSERVRMPVQVPTDQPCTAGAAPYRRINASLAHQICAPIYGKVGVRVPPSARPGQSPFPRVEGALTRRAGS